MCPYYSSRAILLESLCLAFSLLLFPSSQEMHSRRGRRGSQLRFSTSPFAVEQASTAESSTEVSMPGLSPAPHFGEYPSSEHYSCPIFETINDECPGSRGTYMSGSIPSLASPSPSPARYGLQTARLELQAVVNLLLPKFPSSNTWTAKGKSLARRT